MSPRPTTDRLRRSGNVVFLTARVEARVEAAARRSLADAIVAGGALAGLAFAAQQLAVALSAA